MDNKKTFIKPELDIVLFTNEDIIVTSAGDDEHWGGIGGKDDNQIP